MRAGVSSSRSLPTVSFLSCPSAGWVAHEHGVRDRPHRLARLMSAFETVTGRASSRHRTERWRRGSPMSDVISLNDQGEQVSVHQSHLNDRLKAHNSPQIKVDGTCGPTTISQSAFAAWFLGALPETIKAVQGGTISIGVQGMIADPNTRDDGQRERAVARRDQTFPGGSAAGDIKIVLADEWGAAAPTGHVTAAGRPQMIIFHHTEGHHPELDHQPGDTLDEAKAFARAIQRDHMHRQPPYIDSGHNFLVTRSGHILEGRHGSVAAIRKGTMVVSAHCPGRNDQPGIEHEHLGAETITRAQREASLSLHEFICRHTGIKATEVHPHKQFFATDCPGALEPILPGFRAELAKRLGQ